VAATNHPQLLDQAMFRRFDAVIEYPLPTAVHGGVAIIDEGTGTRIAQRDGIDVHGTLWLVANGLRTERLARPDAERIVHELAATDMALPVDGAGFVEWA